MVIFSAYKGFQLELQVAVQGKEHQFCCSMECYWMEWHGFLYPQPSSIKNMIHLAQMIRRGTMVKYDYNNEGENRSHYGQPNPPDYNVTNIPADFPLFFSYGERDALSDVQDVRFLMDVLKGQNDSRQGKFMAQYLENYAHMDFIMAESAKEQVYDSVLSFNKLH